MIDCAAVIGQQRLYGLVQKNTSLGTHTSPQAHLGTSVQFQEVFAFLVRHLHAVVSGQEAGQNLQAGIIEQLRETFVIKDILYRRLIVGLLTFSNHYKKEMSIGSPMEAPCPRSYLC